MPCPVAQRVFLSAFFAAEISYWPRIGQLGQFFCVNALEVLENKYMFVFACWNRTGWPRSQYVALLFSQTTFQLSPLSPRPWSPKQETSCKVKAHGQQNNQ
jgi:hypothetical protein